MAENDTFRAVLFYALLSMCSWTAIYQLHDFRIMIFQNIPEERNRDVSKTPVNNTNITNIPINKSETYNLVTQLPITTNVSVTGPILQRYIWDGVGKQYPFEYVRNQMFHIPRKVMTVLKPPNITSQWNDIAEHLKKTWIKLPVSGFAFFSHTVTFLERQQLVYSFIVFMDICERHDITYFLTGGSLLGVYRHHGIIPWDDDIDVAVNASDWLTLHRVLSNVPGFTLYAVKNKQWKFHMTKLIRHNKNPYLWPFIDIFFYAENSTHVWGITTLIKYQVHHKKSDVFPLFYRPFENSWAPIPCNPLTFLRNTMQPKNCGSQWFSHKYSMRPRHLIIIECFKLYNIFPFVFRSQSTNESRVIEKLQIGNLTIHSYVLPAFSNTARP